jgi:hypothetical protein
MLDGKMTVIATVDASGKTTCAMPIDEGGVTQGLEDCVSARFATMTFDRGEPWTMAVPIALRSGKLGLGERVTQVTGIESVETHRMPDAFEELEVLTPKLEGCIHQLDAGSGVKAIVVGARVALDGRTQCAVASPRSGTLPSKISSCMTDVFSKAKFPPPKGGPGTIHVPMQLTER